MNLSQLQYFKVLAQEEHYTRAAQMLSITQPSLSHAISQLEQELGTRLFEKKGRNVVLTRYGKMFLPYVEESLKVLNEGVQRIQESMAAGMELYIWHIYIRWEVSSRQSWCVNFSMHTRIMI